MKLLGRTYIIYNNISILSQISIIYIIYCNFFFVNIETNTENNTEEIKQRINNDKNSTSSLIIDLKDFYL